MKRAAISAYDLVIEGGTVATGADTIACDIGIKDGGVATLGRGLDAGAREIDVIAAGCLPGGIDSHCHVEQRALTTKSPRGDTPLVQAIRGL